MLEDFCRNYHIQRLQVEASDISCEEFVVDRDPPAEVEVRLVDVSGGNPSVGATRRLSQTGLNLHGMLQCLASCALRTRTTSVQRQPQSF